MKKFEELFEYQSKSGIKAGDGLKTGKYPFFTSSNLQVKRLNEHQFDGDSLIFGTGGEASVHFVTEKFAVSTDCLVAQPKEKQKIITKYYYYYLKNNNMRILEKGFKGAGLKHISKGFISQISLPETDLNTQNKVVQMLDKSDSLRQKRKEQIKLLDDFLKSKFLEMFGDPLANPKSIRQERIGDVGSVITGNTPSRQNKDYYGHYLEWIKSDNINTPQFILTQASEYLSQKGTTVCRIAPTGSVLVTCIAGSPDCIGNSAMANRDVAFNQQINAFLPGKEVLQEFFFSQLLVCKRLIQQASSEGMKGLVSKSKFSNIKILMPSVDQQRIFVGTFRSVANIRDLLQSGILQLDNSYQALMQQFF